MQLREGGPEFIPTSSLGGCEATAIPESHRRSAPTRSRQAPDRRWPTSGASRDGSGFTAKAAVTMRRSRWRPASSDGACRVERSHPPISLMRALRSTRCEASDAELDGIAHGLGSVPRRVLGETIHPLTALSEAADTLPPRRQDVHARRRRYAPGRRRRPFLGARSGIASSFRFASCRPSPTPRVPGKVVTVGAGQAHIVFVLDRGGALRGAALANGDLLDGENVEKIHGCRI